MQQRRTSYHKKYTYLWPISWAVATYSRGLMTLSTAQLNCWLHTVPTYALPVTSRFCLLKMRKIKLFKQKPPVNYYYFKSLSKGDRSIFVVDMHSSASNTINFNCSHNKCLHLITFYYLLLYMHLFKKSTNKGFILITKSSVVFSQNKLLWWWSSNKLVYKWSRKL